MTARRLVRSLCATINSVEAQSTGTSPDDRPMLVSTAGSNLQLQASGRASASSTTATTTLQYYSRLSAGSDKEISDGVLQRSSGNFESLDIFLDVDGVYSSTRNEREPITPASSTTDGMPRDTMLPETAPSNLLRQSVEGSRFMLRHTERDVLARVDASRLSTSTAPTSAQDERRTVLSGYALPRMTVFEEQTGSTATAQTPTTSQISRGNAATSSPVDSPVRADRMETSTSTSSTAYNASTQNVLLYPNGVEPASMTTSSQQPSTILQARLLSASWTSYSFAGALTILGFSSYCSSMTAPPLPLHKLLSFTTP